MLAIIILATIMALFGILGHQRGTRSSVFAAGLILLGLVGMRQMGGTLAAAINILAVAIKLVFSGGLRGLESTADQRASLQELLDNMSSEHPPARSDGAGFGMFLLFVLIVVVALAFTNQRWFRGKPSAVGLLAGLASGYMVGVFLVNRLFADSVSLPLPFGLGTLEGKANLAPESIAFTDGGDLIAQLGQLISIPSDKGSLALGIVAGIALFVVLVTRFANKKG